MFIKFGGELVNIKTINRVSLEVCESFEEHTITMENSHFLFSESYKSEVDAHFKYNQICELLRDWELIIE